MKTPVFWYRSSLLAPCLAPLSLLYRLGAKIHAALRGPAFRASAPVICIGNAVAGGAGKTPTAMALVELLKRHGVHPALVSRGYGGRETGPLRVDPALHEAADVGDEPLLLAQCAPCWIGRNRAAAVRAAAASGASPILMDDGFQNPTVAKDIALLVIDGETGLGNGRLIPAGPLREPFSEALAKASAVVLIGEDKTGLLQAMGQKPVCRATLHPDLPADFQKGSLFWGFSGIARPQKFYTTCAKLGLSLVGTTDFPDHHLFSAADLRDLSQQAAEKGARLLTTTKDWVRLPADFRKEVDVLPVKLIFDDEPKILSLLGV